LPEPETARKRPRRFWLYAPYAVVLAGAVLWSLAWIWLRGEVAGRMDASAERLRLAGYTVDWSARRISGYPFRMEVVFDGLTLAERSGWRLNAPQVRAEAYAYELSHWVGYAPNGLVLTRPQKGAVTIKAPILRASLSATGQAPRIAVEMQKPTFAPQAGAAPFVVAAAERADLQVRPAGDDKAEFLLRLDKATAPAGSILALIGQDRPMDIAWKGQVSRLGAFKGGDWPTVAQAWTAAGGAVLVEHGLLTAGATTVNLRPGQLSTGLDGRLRGSVGLDLRQAPDLIGRLAAARTIDATAADSAATVARARAAGGAVTSADLTFMAGATLFGPVAIGPSPRVY
jgi:hypothetical protein